MPTSIPLTGLGSDDVVPGNYVEVNFAQGLQSSANGTYAAIILANKTSAGTGTTNSVIYGPDTQIPITGEADLKLLAGVGSPAHRMGKRFWQVNKSTPLYFCFPTVSGGTVATGTITVSTTATGAGTYRVYVGDEFCDSTIASGYTVTNIADEAVLAINAKLDWPVTAANVAGVITLTAKVAGLHANWIRYGSQVVIASGSSIATTTSPTVMTYMTGGGTLESYTTALATILPYRFYYIIPEAEDATTLTAIMTQVNTQAQPITGVRQRVVSASIDTAANAITVATTENAARLELPWMAQLDMPPAELAANMAAIYSLEEAPTSFKCNFDGYGNDAATSTRWFIRAPRSGAAPTRAQIKSALNNGVTPIAVSRPGVTYLVKRITTRSLNGSTVDYRIRDAHKVTVCDRFADDLGAKFTSQFSGKKIGDNPAKGQKPPGRDVVYPDLMKASINKLTQDYADNDLVQNVDQIKADTQCIREASPRTRLSARVPLQTIDILDQTTTAVDQVA